MSKSHILLLLILTFVIGLRGYLKTKTGLIDTQTVIQELNAYKLANVIGCAPDATTLFIDPMSIPLLPGSGNHRMEISTGSDSAALYFNQGLTMFYGFHFIESRASFKKAQSLDSSCAMAYLGEALTYGPNINNSAYKLRPYTLSLLEKSKRHLSKCTAIEKALIEAQFERFTADTSLGIPHVNKAHADAMKKMQELFPVNADVAALYADALMQLHPWDLYDNKGTLKPWTGSIEREIERCINSFPEHPGLNHYYIHCVEASNTATRGLESAYRLQRLTPGLSHMMHMASHIFIRTGLYEEGVIANTKARQNYEQYKSMFPEAEKYKHLYYTHNLAMEFANALFLPDYALTMRLARMKQEPFEPRIENSDNLSNDEQLSYSSPFIGWVRYEQWDSILSQKMVPPQYIYSRFIENFARILALSNQHKVSEAISLLKIMEKTMSEPSLREHREFSNPALASCKVALHIARGAIASEYKNYEEAVFHFEEAVRGEDDMIYNEPKDWLLPARQFLGNCLLKAGKFKRAEKVFKADLRLNPSNIWSLNGLKQTQK